MTFIVTAVGLAMSIFYIFGIPEVKLGRQAAYFDDIYQKKK